MDSATLKHTFNSVADAYNKFRPRYPNELFDDLVKKSGLTADARLLEIAPGTGQATLPLAERGYSILAIELGSGLADVARQQLKEYPKIEVITGAFEKINLPDDSFNLIYSATAFHWIKPEFQFVKPYRLLKSGGYLGVIHSHHVASDDNVFYEESRPIYKKYGHKRPKDPLDAHDKLPRIEEIKEDYVDSVLFQTVFFKVYPVVISYTADELAGVVSTYSPTLAMLPESRKAFLDELRGLVNERFGGVVTKHYGMSMTIARRREV